MLAMPPATTFMKTGCFFMNVVLNMSFESVIGDEQWLILQIKSMDDQLYQALKLKAESENRSLSRQVIMILKDYLSRPDNKAVRQTEAFLQLSGAWQDNRSPEDIIEEIIDRRPSRRFEETEDLHVF